MKRRTGLAARITALGVAVAIVTGVVAGGLAVGLVRSDDLRHARQTLSRLADAAAVDSAGAAGRNRVERTLAAVSIRVGYFGEQGGITSDAPLARIALTPTQLARVHDGQPVSREVSLRGTDVLIEARPIAGQGGVVLLERRRDATADASSALRRALLAILVGVAAAAIIAALLANRLARPLRRIAQNARALAAGRRDVQAAPGGPREVVEVSDAVNTLSEVLRHSEARQREFLLSVSHDLRTPLTAITGYAESLADGLVPADQTAAVGTVLSREAERLSRLVTDLLDLARLDGQDFRIELGPVDLAALAREAAPVWAQRCAAAGVQFRCEVPDWALPARTDASRVRQVLDGLLENALRVTPAGAPIVLAVRADGLDDVVAEVRDGGPGLTDDDIAVAFERAELYRRYRGVRQVGTGLGLAIVHGLVTRLGGVVEAGHAPEGGARFTVRLPRRSPDQEV